MRLQFIILIILNILLPVTIYAEENTNSTDEEIKKDYILTGLWETEQILKIPESVIYDFERDILYVSNINGSPMIKDGNGFISRVKMDGEIEELKWIDGLNAPKGSAIYEGKLFVADIDQLVEIDIEKGIILNRYTAVGALFLNDVVVDNSGNIYISDMSPNNSVIYKFTEGKIEVWLESDLVNRPNGLYIEGEKLIVGTSGDGYLKSISLSGKEIRTIAHTGFGIDGIQGDGRGNYFVSDWSGRTSIVTSSGIIKELLNTTKSKINSADIEYIGDKNILLIPTFYDNRIVAYRVERK